MTTNLRDIDRNTDITPFVTWVRASEPTIITNTALDGTTYIQLVGEPIVEYKVTAYVSRSQREELDASVANGSLMSCVTSRGTARGRINKKISYGDRLPGDYFKAEFTLAREE